MIIFFLADGRSILVLGTADRSRPASIHSGSLHIPQTAFQLFSRRHVCPNIEEPSTLKELSHKAAVERS
jgi:hypothetical protein